VKRAALFSALLVTLVWVLAVRPAAMPPLFPLGPQPVYGPSDDGALVALEPVLHAPWLSSPAGPVVWVVALMAFVGACAVAQSSGASALAAFFVSLALAMDPSFGAALAHLAPAVMATGLVWLVAAAVFDDASPGPPGHSWSRPALAVATWSLAVWWHWLAVVTWPIVWAAFRRTPDRPGRGWWTLASLAAGLVAFIGHFAWMASAGTDITTTSTTFGWQDALSVAFESRGRVPAQSFASPEVTTRVGNLVIALTLVGVMCAPVARWWRRTALAIALLALVVATAWPAWQPDVLRLALWALAPLAAVGLSWAAREGGRPVVLTGLLGSIAVGEAVVNGARPVEGVEGRGFRDAIVQALAAEAATSPVLVVAEDTRVDSALVPWMAVHTPHVRRGPQDDEVVRRALAEGRLVLAGPTARRHLELTGVSFTDHVAITQPLRFVLSAVDATYRCVAVSTDRWSQLPGLEYTGRLGLVIPPHVSGALLLVAGDTLPLAVRATTPDGADRVLDARPLSSGPGASPPPADYWIDGTLDEAAQHAMERLRFAADPLRTQLVSVALGRRAPKVIARLAGYGGEARGRVCAAPVGATYFDSGSEAVLPLDADANLASGWYGLEGRGADRFRWAAPDAFVLMRSARRADVLVTLVTGAARPTDGDGETTVTLRVNGVDAGSRVLRQGEERLTWPAPAGVWVEGTNELWWHTSRVVRPSDRGGADTRVLALRVKEIRVGLSDADQLNVEEQRGVGRDAAGVRR
jgi:hypothetical protein